MSILCILGFYAKHPHIMFAMEILLKRKAKYSWHHCTKSLDQNTVNIFFHKTNYLNEVKCTEPSPPVSIPCKIPHKTKKNNPMHT